MEDMRDLHKRPTIRVLNQTLLSLVTLATADVFLTVILSFQA